MHNYAVPCAVRLAAELTSRCILADSAAIVAQDAVNLCGLGRRIKRAGERYASTARPIHLRLREKLEKQVISILTIYHTAIEYRRDDLVGCLIFHDGIGQAQSSYSIPLL